MNYYFDTEFIEGSQTKRLLSIPIGKTKPTIDLISIGIVAEDGREYYAISKDFNLKEAWNRYDWKQKKVNDGIPGAYKEYWIRENVLKPIYLELLSEETGLDYTNQEFYKRTQLMQSKFEYNQVKMLIDKYGKTNKQIAREVKHFVATRPINSNKEQWILDYDTKNVQFYAYYCDYDWVVFCWLFGRMIDLPKGFPMYCNDLKQELERKRIVYGNETPNRYWKELEKHNSYPKQINEHNALADAKWTKALHDFLNSI